LYKLVQNHRHLFWIGGSITNATHQSACVREKKLLCADYHYRQESGVSDSLFVSFHDIYAKIAATLCLGIVDVRKKNTQNLQQRNNLFEIFAKHYAVSIF
jgi:hypothetical protein